MFEVIRRTVLKQKILSMGIVLAVVGAIVTALLPPWILGSIVDSITGGWNCDISRPPDSRFDNTAQKVIASVPPKRCGKAVESALKPHPRPALRDGV